jgi:hypothetical protein
MFRHYTTPRDEGLRGFCSVELGDVGKPRFLIKTGAAKKNYHPAKTRITGEFSEFTGI